MGRKAERATRSSAGGALAKNDLASPLARDIFPSLGSGRRARYSPGAGIVSPHVPFRIFLYTRLRSSCSLLTTLHFSFGAVAR